MKSFHSVPMQAALAAALLAPTLAAADTPRVDRVGKPARVVCNIVGGQPVLAAHADKIIFKISGALAAVDPGDQADLNAVPRNTELDIKVIDDPLTVADLKGKVLSFLGAVDNAAARLVVKIIDVDYAMVCPLIPQD